MLMISNNLVFQSRMRESIEIREACMADLDPILAIEQASFEHPYSRKFLRYLLSSDETLNLVADTGRRVIGYSSLRIEGKIAHLLSIAVYPQKRRRGIGSQLMQNIQERLKHTCERLLLEVRQSNQGAQKFYEKLGLQMQGRKREYYENGEDAIIYITSL